MLYLLRFDEMAEKIKESSGKHWQEYPQLTCRVGRTDDGSICGSSHSALAADAQYPDREDPCVAAGSYMAYEHLRRARLSGVFEQNLMHIMVMRFKKALQDWIARRAGEVYLKQETDTEKKTSTTISGVTIAAVWFALHEHRALSAASCTFEYTNASNLRPRAELRPSFVEGGLAAGKPARIAPPRSNSGTPKVKLKVSSLDGCEGVRKALGLPSRSKPFVHPITNGRLWLGCADSTKAPCLRSSCQCELVFTQKIFNGLPSVIVESTVHTEGIRGDQLPIAMDMVVPNNSGFAGEIAYSGQPPPPPGTVVSVSSSSDGDARQFAEKRRQNMDQRIKERVCAAKKNVKDRVKQYKLTLNREAMDYQTRLQQLFQEGRFALLDSELGVEVHDLQPPNMQPSGTVEPAQEASRAVPRVPLFHTPESAPLGEGSLCDGQSDVPLSGTCVLVQERRDNGGHF